MSKRVVVTGGNGFLGSHVVAELKRRGYKDVVVPRSNDFDLRSFDACKGLLKKDDIVIHLAASVGGIGFNQVNPGSLFYDNAIMGINMIEAARLAGVSKFVCVGTICAYPKFTPVPFKEEHLWAGYPEETNAPYGIAKKALLVQIQSYRQQYKFPGVYLLPVNLYGPRDNFDPRSSHVIPALIRKIHEAQKSGASSIPVWGDGSATREFLFVEDAALGIVDAMERYDGHDPVNLGSGMEISIKDLIGKLCSLMGFKGSVVWDTSKPNGQPRRCLDVSRAERFFGFKAKVPFEDGLKKTIEWYRNAQA